MTGKEYHARSPVDEVHPAWIRAGAGAKRFIQVFMILCIAKYITNLVIFSVFGILN